MSGGRGPLKTLLIVWYSRTGGSRQMADAAAVLDPEVTVRLLHAPAAGSEDLLAADGYIFVAPENLGALAEIGRAHV